LRRGGNITALVENGRKRQIMVDCGRLRQIAAVNGRQLQSRDLKIVYSSEQRRHSSPFFSLALDLYL